MTRTRASSLGRGVARRTSAVAALAGLALVCGASPPPSAGALPASWQNPERVNIDRVGAVRAEPALTIEPSGTLHAVWVERLPGGDQVRYAVREGPSGGWSPSLRVSADRTAERFDPDVAVDSSGRVHAFWVQAHESGSRLMHASLETGRTAWALEAPVDEPAGRVREWAPAAAADRAGNVHVIWEDYRTGGPEILHRRLDPDGRWSPVTRVNSDAEGDQREPALADTPWGELIAVWQDTRDGASHIYASRLPQFGDLWWPDARISAAMAGTAHRRPAIAVDALGRAVAMWLAEDDRGGALRVSELLAYDPELPYWRPDREVYRPTRGSVLEHAVAGGTGHLVSVAWSESRPEASRVYGARLVAGAMLEPERIDVSLAATDGRVPDIALDRSPRAHVVWLGTSRDGALDVFHAWSALDRPAYEPAVQQGWLQYRPREPNCGSGVYAVVSCDGAPGTPILPSVSGLDALLGSYVTVEGESVDEGACPHVAAQRAVLSASPCPRDTGSVTGHVRVAGRPIEGATVTLGDLDVVTGRSGRFFVDRVPAGRQVVTATARCALEATLTAASVPRGFLATVPTVDLVPGDVVRDCKVDVRDLVRVGAAHKSSPPFAPECVDLDGDGEVSVADLAIVGSAYSTRCPTPWGAPAQPGGLDEGREDGRAAPGALVVNGAEGLRAWEVKVRLAAGGGDVPPFDASSMPDGTWVLENRADSSGLASLVAVRLGPAPALRGHVALARPAAWVAASGIRLEEFRLVDDAGRPASGRVVVEGGAGTGRAWLPRLQR